MNILASVDYRLAVSSKSADAYSVQMRETEDAVAAPAQRGEVWNDLSTTQGVFGSWDEAISWVSKHVEAPGALIEETDLISGHVRFFVGRWDRKRVAPQGRIFQILARTGNNHPNRATKRADRA